MIHRLYPIINIQAVVCTNTPSNHGGSPGRRIMFKLGSMVASVPPPSHRSLPLLPRPPRDGDRPQSAPPGAQGPPPGKGVVASSSRASLSAGPGFCLALFPVRPPSPARRPPAEPHRCPPLGWGEARRPTTSPALFLLLSRLVRRTPPPLQGLA